MFKHLIMFSPYIWSIMTVTSMFINMLFSSTLNTKDFLAPAHDLGGPKIQQSCLSIQHVLHHEVKYCYVFSYSCTFNDQIIWFGTDAGTLRTKHFSTNGSLDYFHRSSSNEMRAYKIEQEQLSAVQDPEPLFKQKDIGCLQPQLAESWSKW